MYLHRSISELSERAVGSSAFSAARSIFELSSQLDLYSNLLPGTAANESHGPKTSFEDTWSDNPRFDLLNSATKASTAEASLSNFQ